MANQHLSKYDENTISAMFDRIAPQYDLLNSLLSFKQDHRWRRCLVSWLPQKKSAHLLDVACGTGDVIIETMTKRSEYSDIWGVDVSQKMLDLAESKVANLKFKRNVRFNKMSAENLSFEDQSFDACTISFGLRNVINRKRGLEEFYRVLRPQASFLILEFFPSKSGLMGLLFKFYFKMILPLFGAVLSDRKAYRYLPDSVDTFYDLDGLLLTLEDIGFNIRRKKKYLWGSCVLIEAIKK